MIARPFEPKDYEQISGWWAGHALPKIPLEYLPPTGFLVDHVVAGFLYKTDSLVCILDCFISNPRSNVRDRDLALDLIADDLIASAEALQFKIIRADTASYRIWRRAEKYGFTLTKSPHWGFFKGL